MTGNLILKNNFKENLFSHGNILWLLCSLALMIIYKLPLPYTEEFPRVPYYIGFSFGYALLVFFWTHKNKSPIKINSIIFWLGLIVLCFTEPLFENDHFRYIWEGRVLFNGYNPYTTPPNSDLLDHIIFSKRDFIGFPSLSSIYPPLGLLNYALIGWMNYEWAMITLQIQNALLILLFLKFINYHHYLLYFFPFLQKEFINAVHLDLLAVTPMLWFLVKTNFKTKATAVVVSALIKLNSIFIWSAYIKKNSWKKAITGGTISLLFVVPYLFFTSQGSGAAAFRRDWLWSPGFLTYWEAIFNSPLLNGRYIGFAIFLVVILARIIKSFNSINREDTLDSIILTFSALFFFSPVFNPWYLIWLLPFAITRENIWALIYIFLSCLSYHYWTYGRQIPIVLITHFPFLVISYKLLISRCNKTSLKTE